MNYEGFFRQATGFDRCYDYQRLLAEGDVLPELLDVPTGCGKTEAVILAWLWRRRFGSESMKRATPGRLVYCLPMRVLVKQTADRAGRWLSRLPLDQPVDIQLLMGGEEKTDWDLFPEKDALLIGTQDMILSRALNRGFGMSRFRWPMHFGLLNNDCLWVMDEVQLMGSGLATTVQLDAFRKKVWPCLRPCHSLWMSATVGAGMFDTRDRQDKQLAAPAPVTLTKADREHPGLVRRLMADKVLMIGDKPKAAQLLDEAVEGRLTLLMFNTVPAARQCYQELRVEKQKREGKKKKLAKALPQVCLLHGRFRQIDRYRHMQIVEAFSNLQDQETGAGPDNPGLILVSTQVIEAGVDLSSVRLFSEIAPWASVIQRLGRLNREGRQPQATATFWMPEADIKGENQKGRPNAGRVGPYQKKDLDAAKKLIETLINRHAGGQAYRAALDDVLALEQSRAALQFVPESLIRPDDFFELFSTEPDLAGGFTDVSRFVKDQDRNVEAYVFWREFGGPVPDVDEPAPTREELCSVAFYDLRQFLGKHSAWEWNTDGRRWASRRAADVRPGMTLMLARSLGGYADDLGWTGDPTDDVTPHPPPREEPDSLLQEKTSESSWQTLDEHTRNVEVETDKLVRAFGLAGSALGDALRTSAHWHDVGKLHPRWQQPLQERAPLGARGPWGKFGRIAGFRFRPGLRHEAASALAAWHFRNAGHEELSELVLYLIASHHGKVRTVLRSKDEDEDVFGVFDGDTLPAQSGYFPEPVQLSTGAKLFGSSGTWADDNGSFKLSTTSWVRIVSALLGPEPDGSPVMETAVGQRECGLLGPFALAFLETLLRAADGRASQTQSEGASP
jgi:CRISPR-associated endonuclease/helicase Cas3